ncbi:MAG: YkgJ family cysteine cluster protein [Deltaproteobacteria bacterium]|jgi:Fe-S-cluster containining protein|nr:YkgJ family cysteine cluster protein [Deltaproteobacteria bacterium]
MPIRKPKAASQKIGVLHAFDCRMCGECCRGKGGIVIGPRDLPRLCGHLHTDELGFVALYGHRQDGKIKLRTGPDNYCVFFLPGSGCSVHAHKPDVCRAWPFFRGNMTDKGSFAMAKEFCPGINPMIGHDAFVQAGLLHLKECRLSANDPKLEAIALIGALP